MKRARVRCRARAPLVGLEMVVVLAASSCAAAAEGLGALASNRDVAEAQRHWRARVDFLEAMLERARASGDQIEGLIEAQTAPADAGLRILGPLADHVRDPGSSRDFWIHRAIVDFEQGHRRAARRAMDLASAFPTPSGETRASTMLLRALQALDDARPADAEPLLRGISASSSLAAVARYDLALALHAQGRWEEAADVAESLADARWEGPQSRDFLWNLQLLRARLQLRLDRARDLLRAIDERSRHGQWALWVEAEDRLARTE